MRISIIGSSNCIDKGKKVQDFLFKVKQQFGETATIFSGGNETGIEYEVKKYSLEFGLKYKEFNPSFTGQNLYSFLSEEYFGKGKHPSHYHHRYIELLKRTDRLVIGVDKDDSDWKLYESVFNKAGRMKVQTVFI